ncbi:hypothetical protein [Acinetobacter junii]|uniref:Uncharacterized protein n=1 Tax=Acinetobacter junii TaxID=40215 RepID=A0AAW5R8V7_ACIJU|nr:hypothetical protein [Acinetobacter junii]MCU4395939.1 hypothetical protein [Acinetobacter junii]
MRIPTINSHIQTTPIKNLVKRIESMRLTTNYEEFSKSEAEALAYLDCLNDTQYINSRENFEYQRQIRDERANKLEALTR